MLILLAGTIGRSVTGGQAWANLQYLLGLRALGHEVHYLEDVGDWSSTYDWEAGQVTDSLDYPAQYIDDVLRPHGLGNCWTYRAGENTRGTSLERLRELCRVADLLVIRGVPMIVWRAEYDQPYRRIFIDVDPGFTQIGLAKGDSLLVETIGKSEAVFTFGCNIGTSGCPIPTAGRRWQATFPPLFLDQWPEAGEPSNQAFSSVMRWRGVKDREYEGEIYGQKDREFPNYLSLPRQTSHRFRLALVGGGEKQCRANGWEVIPGWSVSKTADSYRQFIQESWAEFGVAKHCYAKGHVGWVSDRSICYLASGRPILVQDTGARCFSEQLGALTFQNCTQAAEQVARLRDDYPSHALAARRLAERYFASDRVLGELLDRAMSATSV